MTAKDILRLIDSNGAIKTPITKIDGYGGITVDRLTDVSGQYELDEVKISCPITEMYIDGNVSIGGQGTVTSLGIEGNSGIEVSNSPITTSGVIKLDLKNQLKGLIENIGKGILVQTSSSGDYQSRALEAGNGITIDNSDGVEGNPRISFSGQTSGGTVTSVGILANNGIYASGSPITDSGDITLSLSYKLAEFNLHWQQGFLVQTSASGSFESRLLQAGPGISIENADGRLGNPIISATGSGGGGSNEVKLSGAVVGTGYTGPNSIFTSLPLETNYEYDRMYFNWSIHPGAIGDNVGTTHTLIDPGTNINYQETIRTGVNNTGGYRAWDIVYELGQAQTSFGTYNLKYTHIESAQVKEIDAFKIEITDYFGIKKSNVTIFGDLDINNNAINNLQYPFYGHQAANKDYVDSRVGLTYPNDRKLFLNGFGEWQPSLDYIGYPDYYLDSAGNWTIPPNTWGSVQNLNYPTLNVNWQQAAPPGTGGYNGIIHNIQDTYNSDVPTFVKEISTGNDIEQTTRGFKWLYALGTVANGNYNLAHAILTYENSIGINEQIIDIQVQQVPFDFDYDIVFTLKATLFMQKNISMNNNRIHGLPTPITNNEPTTKKYVDDKTWVASQITDFTSQVRANQLNQLALPTANLNMNGQKIVNSALPTLSTDVANKAYVDSVVTSANYIIGEYKFIAGNVVPSKFLLCDGSAVSKTTYATLFSVIGISFGGTSGGATFNLPDLRGKLLAATSSTNILGTYAGTDSQVLTTAQLPTHTHTATDTAVAAYAGSGATAYIKTGTRSDNAVYYYGTNGSSSNLYPLGYHSGNSETFAAIPTSNTHSHPIAVSNSGSSAAVDMRQSTCYGGNYYIYTGV